MLQLLIHLRFRHVDDHQHLSFEKYIYVVGKVAKLKGCLFYFEMEYTE